jgi:hypothetical protein
VTTLPWLDIDDAPNAQVAGPTGTSERTAWLRKFAGKAMIDALPPGRVWIGSD